MEIFQQINDLINIFKSDDKLTFRFPPTEIFSEGWMLRLTLNWFSENKRNDHPLSFQCNSKWYSEALLSSQFLPAFRGDKLSESWTHADGIIGHFEIGNNGFGDVKLLDQASQLIICEAKIYSKYSLGTKNAPDYNQAARNIACICNIISISKSKLNEIANIGFYGLIPEIQQKKEQTFELFMEKDHVLATVEKRIEQYVERKDYQEKKIWLQDWFIPFLERMDIRIITWESVINYIVSNDPVYGNSLSEFYKSCLKYNKMKNE